MTAQLVPQQRQMYTPATMLLAVVVAVSFLGLGFIIPLRTLYAQKLGASSVEIGLMTSSFLLTGFLATPAIGWLSDRYAPRNVLLLGLIMHSLIVLAYIPAREPGLFIGLRALEGIAAAAILPPARALMNSIAPVARQGEALGIVSAAQMVGILLGPAIGAFVAGSFGYAPSFLLASVALGIAAICVYYFLPGRTKYMTMSTKRRGRFVETMTMPLVLVYALSFLLAVLPSGVISAIWSLYMLNRGASLPLIGLTYTAFGVPALIVAPLAGRWSDRYGRYWLTLSGLVMLGIIYTAYGVLSSLGWILVLCVIEGVILIAVESALNGFLADVMPQGMEGRVQANFSAANTAGSFLGATLAGFLYALGSGVPFLALGPLYIGIAVVLLLPQLARLFPSKKLTRQPEGIVP